MLVSLADFKTAIGETGAEHDDLYTFAIQASSQAILNFTDRDFGAAEETEDRVFQLPDAGYIIEIDDCSAVNTVSGLAGSEWVAGREGPVGAAGVYTYIEIPPIRSASVQMGFESNEDLFGRGLRTTITVNADWGWPTIPDDVVQAAIWATSAFAGDQSNTGGHLAAKSVAEVAENYVQQQNQQNASPDDSEPLPARVRSLLLPYRRVAL